MRYRLVHVESWDWPSPWNGHVTEWEETWATEEEGMDAGQRWLDRYPDDLVMLVEVPA